MYVKTRPVPVAARPVAARCCSDTRIEVVELLIVQAEARPAIRPIAALSPCREAPFFKPSESVFRGQYCRRCHSKAPSDLAIPADLGCPLRRGLSERLHGSVDFIYLLIDANESNDCCRESDKGTFYFCRKVECPLILYVPSKRTRPAFGA